MSATAVMPLRVVRPAAPRPASPRRVRHGAVRGVVLRQATADDADAVYALITEHREEGRLLPRERADVQRRIGRFVVAIRGSRVMACAELAPLGRGVAEVRSLVVSRDARGSRLGQRLVDDLVRRATHAGHETLCAFTHAPSYFVRLGFSMVPHVWIPEKISTDCQGCPEFQRCGQVAVVRLLSRDRGAAHA